MPFVHRGPFLGCRLRNDAAWAVEAGVVDCGRVVDHGAILVHTVEAGSDVHQRRVVSECAALPASTVESDAAVTESIVNSAIEPNVRSPVASVPSVSATHKAPIPGCPQQSGSRRSDP